MEMTVTFRAATVKVLVEARLQALRMSDLALVKRTTALLELGERRRLAEVAARVGVSVATLYRWLAAFILRGLDSLRPRRSPGRPPKLTPTQKARLYEMVVAGPLGAGYPSGCWTCLQLQDLIQREFGQTYTHHYIATLLRNLGLSYQKARFVSDHLDPERRRVWREQTWPAILAEAKRRGALLLFGDEATFAQWGSLSYTWAPRGQQPEVRTCGKRKGEKVFGLIDYWSGQLFAHAQTERFSSATYTAFLTMVLEQTSGPIIILQDGASYHTAAATKEFIAAHADRLTVYQLPSYSPDYNPIEHLWKAMKKRTTHLRYFAEFTDLCASVEEGLAYFRAHPEAVKRLMGPYLEQAANCPMAA
jgi:transposase